MQDTCACNSWLSTSTCCCACVPHVQKSLRPPELTAGSCSYALTSAVINAATRHGSAHCRARPRVLHDRSSRLRPCLCDSCMLCVPCCIRGRVVVSLLPASMPFMGPEDQIASTCARLEERTVTASTFCVELTAQRSLCNADLDPRGFGLAQMLLRARDLLR